VISAGGCRTVSDIYIEVGDGTASEANTSESELPQTGEETDESESETDVTSQMSSSAMTTGSESSTVSTTTSDESTLTSTASGTSTDSESGSDEACDTPPAIVPCDEGEGVFRAIELDCDTDVEGVSDITLDESKGLVNTKGLARQFGNSYWTPRGGTDSLLILSTGILPDETGTRFVNLPDSSVDEDSGDNGNANVKSFPSPIVAENGSNFGKGGTPFQNCDGVGDCSDTLHDVLVPGGMLSNAQWLSFSIDVPKGVNSFALDLAFFSAEFARRLGIGETFNDVALVWMSGKLYTGNLATIDGEPLSPGFMLNFLLPAGAFGDTDRLANTGMRGYVAESCEIEGRTFSQCPRGVATPWMTLRGPVVSGETIRIVIAIADQGIDPVDNMTPDNAFDSLLLLDHWRWECERCSWSGKCGLRPADSVR
jgi:hypothetical protein